MADHTFPISPSLSSDASVGLPPFDLFQGTVQQQLQQAIAWRQQELAKLQASSSLSPLEAPSSPVAISLPQQSPSPSTPLPAVPAPQLPTAALPTTPHHHQPHDPLINLPTPCQPHDFAESTLTVALRSARAQSTACPRSAGDKPDCEGDDGASPFSETQHPQKRTCAASPHYKSGFDQYNTQQNMTESVKVKEDSTSQYDAPTVSTMC